MLRTIVLSFTLKGQDFSKIKEAILDIKKKHFPTKNVILLHGFMPRAEVIKKGFSTEVVDFLEETFPIQLNLYADGAPLRHEMVKIANHLDANVYFIGEIKEGVLEEYTLYKSFAPYCSLFESINPDVFKI